MFVIVPYTELPINLDAISRSKYRTSNLQRRACYHSNHEAFAASVLSFIPEHLERTATLGEPKPIMALVLNRFLKYQRLTICCVLVLVALSMPAAGQYYGGGGGAAAAGAAAGGGGGGYGYPYGGHGGGAAAAGAAAAGGGGGFYGRRR
ncbi:hypothetical protein AVEN_154102-1 [Araneus ventricosus]|uniref:Uncharacterized protein n=1 Tax=Araneus ventricosus TaxID=182803 RepID=A0A4Y2TCM8_ARAVE|nr:hypothetical protein AVEN_154102-1 [Araneus ventricosus]